MWTIAKIFPPAAGFLNVLTSFLNVSAHFEVQFFFGLRPKKICQKQGGLSRGIPKKGLSSDINYMYKIEGLESIKAPVLVLEVKQFRITDYSTGFVIMPLINQMTTVGYCRVSAPMSLKRERTIPATFKSK